VRLPTPPPRAFGTERLLQLQRQQQQQLPRWLAVPAAAALACMENLWTDRTRTAPVPNTGGDRVVTSACVPVPAETNGRRGRRRRAGSWRVSGEKEPTKNTSGIEREQLGWRRETSGGARGTGAARARAHVCGCAGAVPAACHAGARRWRAAACTYCSSPCGHLTRTHLLRRLHDGVFFFPHACESEAELVSVLALCRTSSSARDRKEV
jgi:hypothetical protein